MEPINESNIDLTKEERRVLRLLAITWNTFVKLDDKAPEDDRRFADSLSDCQRILLTRVTRRMYPDLLGKGDSEKYEKNLIHEIEKLSEQVENSTDQNTDIVHDLTLAEMELHSLIKIRR